MSRSPSPSLSDEDLLDDLPESFDYAAHRERRMEELASEQRRLKDMQNSDGEAGRVVTHNQEKPLIESISKCKCSVVHFFHPDFQRCRIMDERLAQLAPKYLHTSFMRASVADTPFLVAKFGIQVLPCVLAFIDGHCVDRLIGFEELGNNDTFSANALEFRLKHSGALPTRQELKEGIMGGHAERDGSESEGEGARESRPRRGKTGIRNGLFNAGEDDDF